MWAANERRKNETQAVQAYFEASGAVRRYPVETGGAIHTKRRPDNESTRKKY
jgi:hypothetical protein